MHFYRRILAGSVALCLLWALSGCDGAQPAPTATTSTPVPTSQDAPASDGGEPSAATTHPAPDGAKTAELLLSSDRSYADAQILASAATPDGAYGLTGVVLYTMPGQSFCVGYAFRDRDTIYPVGIGLTEEGLALQYQPDTFAYTSDGSVILTVREPGTDRLTDQVIDYSQDVLGTVVAATGRVHEPYWNKNDGYTVQLLPLWEELLRTDDATPGTCTFYYTPQSEMGKALAQQHFAGKELPLFSILDWDALGRSAARDKIRELGTVGDATYYLAMEKSATFARICGAANAQVGDIYQGQPVTEAQQQLAMQDWENIQLLQDSATDLLRTFRPSP